MTQTRSDGSTGTSNSDELKDKARTTAEQAKSAAGEVAQTAKIKAQEQADAAKDTVANEVAGVASALRTAADELRSGSPQERTFGQIAESMADASDALRDKDLGEMVGDASRFARRNPIVFLGGAALLGFAAARFAKASQNGDTHASDYGTSASGVSGAPVNGSTATTGGYNRGRV